MEYLAGGYIQIKIPEGEVKFSEMDIAAHPQDHPGEPEKFEKDWSEGPYAMRNLVMRNDEEIVRAYSMASYPAEGKRIMLNVRVAAPPWDRAKNTWADINPGVASSYIFGLKEGEKVTFGESELDILFTPGHAPGHIVLHSKEQAFIIGGDVLFQMSIGRTDLPGGNFDTLISSIKEKLLTLDDNTTVYCGHGPSTNIGFEKANNPFLK